MMKTVVEELQTGSYGKKVHYIDLHNGGIKLIKTKHIPDDVWAEVQDIRAGIIDGKIKVPELREKKEVQALIK
jgi:simple sugar transport system substrate-binding protein